jgi:NAD(P)-dependent dehydrogenase (short-subunit alcohol dehydrogenase family)
VTNADIQQPRDYTSPTDGKYQFVKCDVTKFADQVSVFKAALKLSPTGRIDVVVANAGISGNDPVFTLTDSADPEEPDLKILNIDLIGVLYTAKCAMHYWQFDSRPAEDKCFIIKSSLAGYLAVPAATQYSVSKYGVRGLMIQMRLADRCRVNLVAPWFISTAIMSAEVKQAISARLESQGSGWADIEDALKAVLRIATDENINGRALAIVPRRDVREGYMDCQADEYPEGTLMHQWADWAGGASHRALPKEKQ